MVAVGGVRESNGLPHRHSGEAGIQSSRPVNGANPPFVRLLLALASLRVGHSCVPLPGLRLSPERRKGGHQRHVNILLGAALPERYQRSRRRRRSGGRVQRGQSPLWWGFGGTPNFLTASIADREASGPGRGRAHSRAPLRIRVRRIGETEKASRRCAGLLPRPVRLALFGECAGAFEVVRGLHGFAVFAGPALHRLVEGQVEAVEGHLLGCRRR